mmetsp:Transcript_2408/g.9312  ORF Transcript_2408/g.9312 Transcript_2408/m.9312 type:complete len:250 (+) Transcript_2408:2461-3210(+)
MSSIGNRVLPLPRSAAVSLEAWCTTRSCKVVTTPIRSCSPFTAPAAVPSPRENENGSPRSCALLDRPSTAPDDMCRTCLPPPPGVLCPVLLRMRSRRKPVAFLEIGFSETPPGPASAEEPPESPNTAAASRRSRSRSASRSSAAFSCFVRLPPKSKASSNPTPPNPRVARYSFVGNELLRLCFDFFFASLVLSSAFVETTGMGTSAGAMTCKRVSRWNKGTTPAWGPALSGLAAARGWAPRVPPLGGDV